MATVIATEAARRSPWLIPLRYRWIFSTAVLIAATTQAHKPSDSYLTLTVQETHVVVRWDVALRDLDPELGLDASDDGLLSWGEVRARAGDIAAFVIPHLYVGAESGSCPIMSEPYLVEDRVAVAAGTGTAMSLATHSDGTYAVLQYRLHCTSVADALTVDYHLFATSDPTYRGIVRVINGASGSRALSKGAHAVLGPGSSNHQFKFKDSSKLATLLGFISEGIWHIWLGFDHVLFLLTLLLPSVLLASAPRIGDRRDLTVTILDVLKLLLPLRWRTR